MNRYIHNHKSIFCYNHTHAQSVLSTFFFLKVVNNIQAIATKPLSLKFLLVQSSGILEGLTNTFIL